MCGGLGGFYCNFFFAIQKNQKKWVFDAGGGEGYFESLLTKKKLRKKITWISTPISAYNHKLDEDEGDEELRGEETR